MTKLLKSLHAVIEKKISFLRRILRKEKEHFLIIIITQRKGKKRKSFYSIVQHVIMRHKAKSIKKVICHGKVGW